MKTVICVAAGVAGGMFVANMLTDGAVFDAVKDTFDGIRGSKVVETATEAAEAAAEVVADATAQ